MTYTEKLEFAYKVKQTIKLYPDLYGEIVKAMDEGISERIQSEREFRTDLESLIIAFAQMSGMSEGTKKTKANREFAKRIILAKLTKHKDSFNFNLDKLITDFEENL